MSYFYEIMKRIMMAVIQNVITHSHIRNLSLKRRYRVDRVNGKLGNGC